MSGAVIGAGLAAVFVIAWGALVVRLRSSSRSEREHAAGARAALADFSAQSLELQSLEEIFDFAAQASRVIFETTRPIGFAPGDGGAWTARVPDTGEALAEVPAAVRGVFGWFRHNPGIALRVDLADPRLGAMRAPLRQIMDQYGIDVLMPLVHNEQSIGVFGLALAGAPTRTDRDLMRQFRLEVTQASANVRLHREASHVISLAKEVDLASAVQQTLVPAQSDGGASGIEWAGHFRAAGDAGSDFWTAYNLPGERVLILIADATGVGLAGSMLSAVARSCCDGLLASPEGPATDDPATLLSAVNVALWRPEQPVHMRAFAAVFDSGAGVLRYANAGHRSPYHLRGGTLGVLSGAGPVLGDEARASYRTVERPVGTGDTLLFYTDGLVGTRNPEGGAFGERKLQRLLGSVIVTGAPGLRDAVVTEVDKFRGGAPLADDEAMVVVRVR